MRGFAWTLFALAAAGGCSAGGGGAYEGGIEGGIYEVSLDLPAGCPPEAGGNEKHVGQPCTMKGGECAKFGVSNLVCTCDKTLGIQLTGVPCVCTLIQLAQTGSTDPCGAPLPANFCGSNATCCPYLTAGAYCVPNICLAGNLCPVVGQDAGP
jgi:hypothetical protein